MLDEVIALARGAPSPNTGWARMCELAAGALGERPLAVLRELDLADDAIDLRGILVEIRRALPIPRGVDTLAFGLGEDGLAIVGMRRGAPVWLPENRTVVLESLNAIHRLAAKQRGAAARRVLDELLRFGAAALICRFAAEELRHRIEVGGVEIRESRGRGASSRTALAARPSPRTAPPASPRPRGRGRRGPDRPA